MDPSVNQEWTSIEVEEARSLIVGLSSKNSINDDRTDRNKKHNDIVDELHAWFPHKTMQQVTDLYVNLVVEMYMMQWQEESHGATGNMHELMNDNFGVPEEDQESGAAARGTHGVFTMGEHLVRNKFGVLEEEATAKDGNGLVFGCPLERMRTMEMEEALPMVEENKMEVLENNVGDHQPVVALGRFWTTQEHRLFLRGLRVYGRGDWKNISKYFVTTRTPVQVSSHAQKYFRKLESRGSSGRQRYSINDIGLHDADPWAVNNSSGVWQALAFPSFGLQAPMSPFVTMNNLAQFWSPFLYNQQLGQQPSWSEQQMMGSAVTPMEWAGNLVPACQQGSTYLHDEQWMNNI